MGATAAAAAGAGAAHPRMTDYARASRQGDWLHHPVLGDPSWDAFVREPGNPLLVGSAPYEWPVNGFLFRDPRSGRWYTYASVYPRGYFAAPGANARIFRERDGGGWEDMGLLFHPPYPAFAAEGDRRGAMTDPCVVYDGGRYHLIYGWCDPENRRGGLGYAVARDPEGPFVCAPTPLHDDHLRVPVLDVYVRAYASTLLRRRRDWLILHMMSTPGNAGGTWGLFAMTASRADGPYSEPVPLLVPQSNGFHLPLAEFFPAFAHRGRVYAPATSVARNRSFQSIFAAPLERAHAPEAWRMERCGSVWHSEPVPSEARGIWGQTFSGQVGPDGDLRVMFPSKTRDDLGTIGIARRPWSRWAADGFTLSANNAPAAAILRHAVADFRLEGVLRGTGPYAICWGCTGPLGPDHASADSVHHPRMRSSRTELRVDGRQWTLAHFDAGGAETVIAAGRLGQPGAPQAVAVTCAAGRATIALDRTAVYSGSVLAEAGRIEVVAMEGVLRVLRFGLAGGPTPGTHAWLATEALAGAAAPAADWRPATGAGFRCGAGFESARAGARAKWNYLGRGFRLFAPRARGYGRCTVIVDGAETVPVDCAPGAGAPGAPLLERDLAPGLHAVVVVAADACVPLDTLEVDP